MSIINKMHDDIRKYESILFHVPLALLFVGMTLVFCGVPFFRLSNAGIMDTLFILTFSLAVPFILLMQFRGTWKPHLLLVDVLLIFTCLAGIPGILLYGGDDTIRQLAYGGFILFRSYALFILIPRTLIAQRLDFNKYTSLWFVLAIFIVVYGSLYISFTYGLSIDHDTRLGLAKQQHWIHANGVGMFGALGIIISLRPRYLPYYVRLFLVIPSIYVLVLSGARSSIAMLFVVIFVMGIMRVTKGSTFGALVLTHISLLAFILCLPSLQGSVVPMIINTASVHRTIKRTFNNNDPTTGRFGLLENAYELLATKPLTGFGLKGDKTYIENGYMNIMLESGLPGITLFLSFTLLVLRKALSMLKNDSYSQISSLVVILTVCMLTRSFGERSHWLQGYDIIGSLWLLLAGYMFTPKTYKV